ncbi:MAG: peptidylprolyl isomerase [Candidatus Nanopelagicales bacterium]
MSNAKKPGTGVTNKRRRELAAAKADRQAARRAERAAVHRRRVRVGWGIAALVGVLVLAGILLWPDSGTETVAGSGSTAAPSASTSPLAGCDPAPEPQAEPQTWDTAPKMQLESGTDYILTLTTNCGDVVVETLAKKAPQTVNSMLWLAGQGYFDQTPCHRLTTEGIFVLQCGDPTATGTGGPGYTVADENLPAEEADNYPAGTVAMANSGPGTSGSQFFIVYEDTTLPAAYTIWGRVKSGLDVVKTVAEAGVSGGGSDGAPAAPIGIVTARAKPAVG